MCPQVKKRKRLRQLSVLCQTEVELVCPSVPPLDTLVYLLERKQTLESCEVEHFSSTVKKKTFLSMSTMETTTTGPPEEPAMEVTEPPKEPLQRPYEANVWRDSTMTTTFGPVLVFHSENHPGHCSVMGAIRLPRMSSHRISDYLTVNYMYVKSQGMRFWHAQNKLTNNALGFGKRLALDEFGITFSLRYPDSTYSINGRHEIGLWALDFPKLLMYSNLAGPISGKADQEEDAWELIIKAHFYLLDEKKRRTTYIAELQSKASAPAPNGKLGTHVLSDKELGERSKNPPKKPHQQGANKRPRSVDPEPTDGGNTNLKQAKTNEEWKEKLFPKLSRPKVPLWNKDGMIPIPPPLPEY